MPEIKRIDPREFKERGFLQEANRQFFHPHGLALELTTVTGEDGALRVCVFNDAEFEELRALVAAGAPATAVSDRLDQATTYQPGESWFSGCWDYRDDPEGVIFGDNAEDKTAKAYSVAPYRQQHFNARCDLFGVPADIRNAVVNPDVEPLGWVLPDDSESEAE